MMDRELDATRPTALSDVKARVRSQHVAIAQVLDAVTRAAARVKQGEPGSVLELREAIWSLYVMFGDHLTMEETELVPLLRQSEGWSDARETAMLEEHRQQRTVLDALVDEAECGTKDDEELADDAAWLVRSIVKDIADEEAELSL